MACKSLLNELWTDLRERGRKLHSSRGCNMKFEFLSRGTPSSLPSSRPSTFNNLLFETSYRETRVFLLLRRAHDRRKIVQLRSFFLTLAMICILFFFFLSSSFFFLLFFENERFIIPRGLLRCAQRVSIHVRSEFGNFYCWKIIKGY